MPLAGAVKRPALIHWMIRGEHDDSHGRLTLTAPVGLAAFKHEFIKVRTEAGRARAKARGVRLGRKPTLNSFQRTENHQSMADFSYGSRT
jgi:DNA invertase Pin-like site-specific DNA recombinase